ncbi:MAG: protein phosphatase 2C domain-containing protein [Pseudomonadota bacterium]
MSVLDSGQISLIGDRSINQDRLGLFEQDGSVLLVVADGLGGHPRGEVAAETLLELCQHAFQEVPKPIPFPQRFLKQLFQEAHGAILERGMQQTPPVNPRTTGVIALIQRDEVLWAHVGDSRCYLFRKGELLVRTVDHSLAESMPRSLSAGGLSLTAPVSRNLITRCLGGTLSLPQASFGVSQPLQSQDILLLCSDGFWGTLHSREMAQALTAGQPLPQVLDELARRAEDRGHPSSDNVTAVAVRWEATDPMSLQSTGQPPGKKPKGKSE